MERKSTRNEGMESTNNQEVESVRDGGKEIRRGEMMESTKNQKNESQKQREKLEWK